MIVSQYPSIAVWFDLWNEDINFIISYIILQKAGQKEWK